LASDGADVSALLFGRFTTVVLPVPTESNVPHSRIWLLKIYVVLLGIEPRFFSSFSPQSSHCSKLSYADYAQWLHTTQRILIMPVIFSVLWVRINFQHFFPRTTGWGVTWFRAQLYLHVWNWNFADKMLLLYVHSWGRCFMGHRELAWSTQPSMARLGLAPRASAARAAWFILRSQWFVTQGAQATAAKVNEVPYILESNPICS